MKAYLLDTHTFLWWSLEPEKLPDSVRQVLADPDARVVFSVVSSWEAQIKAGLGKLELSDPLQTIVERGLVRNRWEVLPIHLRHTWGLADLPPPSPRPVRRLHDPAGGYNALDRHRVLGPTPQKIEKALYGVLQEIRCLVMPDFPLTAAFPDANAL